MTLFEFVKIFFSFNQTKTRLDVIDNHAAILQSMNLGCRIAYEHESKQRIWGGDKRLEVPRERKDFNDDIVLPLGPIYFKRSYRMTKHSFYKLYSTLKQDLKKEFIKTDNEQFKKRKKD